ncbi:PRTRC system ParB family protein [Sphingomonas sp. ABOLE]|uniref:PRTRC system ParB family protein n=1 Tax=Sphingomonas sp. ABOLE TaxID=1985878 RepID=UPI000F7EAD75|nr:PRTRC system ParB family protein [Sphingomonas sp. ABOLE]RSV44388.1 PRTRC system ParB family protein [Sphingomonas sp. ABOLE]
MKSTIATAKLSQLAESPFTSVPLANIRAGENPRRYFDRGKHDELVASLRLRGMLQPILLRPAPEPNGGYSVVAGGRRYRAAIEAFGPDGQVPAIIREMSDQEALEAAIDENDVREDASETEQADAAVRVLAACADDRAEAARRLGWSASKLDRRLALANLTPAVKTALDERKIKVGHAELLAAVPGDKQDKALETILTSGIDVAKTRELLMRVTHSLAAATFDKAECAGCGYNSARQCALFDTHVEDGHCTNAACFALKVEAAQSAERVSAPSSAPAVNGKPEAPAATANKPVAPAKGKVTATVLAAKLTATRQREWRDAVAAVIVESADHLRVADLAGSFIKSGTAVGFEKVTALASEFDVDLRQHWRVDRDFLELMTRDELKFVAKECGLISHMGEKQFAAVVSQPLKTMIGTMLNAPGFDWAGRIPSSMSLAGNYEPPHAAEARPTSAITKD